MICYILIGLAVAIGWIFLDKFAFKWMKHWDQEFVPVALIIITIFWPFVVTIGTIFGILAGLYLGFQRLYERINK